MEDCVIQRSGAVYVILAAGSPVLSFESRRAAEEAMNKMIALESSREQFRGLSCLRWRDNRDTRLRDRLA
jgi:hypothetical protein